MQVLRHSPTARDFRRRKHSRRVADLSEAVASDMRLPRPQITAIRLAALLHDVGNVGIADEILLKPGPLTDAEFFQIQKHVLRGARDFEAVETLREAIPIVRHHHERINGSGYPEGLSGEEIPLGARVVAAADAYVMMTADVPWRAAKSHEEAIRELEDMAGVHLDEDIVSRLVSILRQRAKDSRDGGSSH